MTIRAIPVHTIIRYCPNDLAFYRHWAPVRVLRYRLFENASHEEVTGGDRGGARWIHDWSCESLTLPEEGGYWRINGRNSWATLDVALAAVSEGTFATFEEALKEARKIAERNLAFCKRRLMEAEWALAEVLRGVQPVLP